MIRIGSLNTLKVIKTVEFGVYLDGGEEEILLPKRYVKAGTKVDDRVEVFIYRDSEDRLIATTAKPKAVVGDIVLLTVKDVNNIGAFLDWGLDKDLFLPFSQFDEELKKNDKVLVRVLLDKVTKRIMATTKLGRYIEREDIDLREGDEVQLIIWKFKDNGIQAVINEKYTGMLYENEVFKDLKIGDRVTGFVKKIRDDKKIDLTLRKKGYAEVLEAKDDLLAQIQKNGGFIPLTDDSSPEEIKRVLNMSKKTFKKALGGLYKAKLVNIKADGVELIK